MLREVQAALATQQEGTAWGGDQLSASLCTPALPLGHVKLLNGWSVSEFTKLFQLDSGLLGNSIFSSPKNRHLHAGFSVLCLAEPPPPALLKCQSAITHSFFGSTKMQRIGLKGKNEPFSTFPASVQ